MNFSNHEKEKKASTFFEIDSSRKAGGGEGKKASAFFEFRVLYVFELSISLHNRYYRYSCFWLPWYRESVADRWPRYFASLFLS
jgi:hypothetical protein